MRRLRLVVCLSVGLAASACGGSGTNDLSNPILACRSFATAACNRLSACEPGQVEVDSCIQLLQANQNCNLAGCPTQTTYSGAGAQECLAAYQNQACQDSQNNVTPPSCAQSNLCVPN